MSRRRRLESIDSMDLLLDTVSNVFGGVMFLTLLAALLVISRGGDRLKEKSNAGSTEQLPPMDLSTNIEALELKLSELDFMLEAQARTLSDLVPSDDAEQKTAQYDHLQKQLMELQKRSEQVQTGVRNAESLQNATAEMKEDLEQQFRELTAQVKAKKVELKKAEEKSSRMVTFSLLRDASTAEVPLLLRYGKVYRLRTGSVLEEINAEDIEVLKDKQYLPKKSGGMPVTPSVLSNLVSKMVDRFPPGEYHITIFVWDDSFAAFNSLRNKLVEQGYQYRTLPCTDETTIGLGGGDRLVQ